MEKTGARTFPDLSRHVSHATHAQEPNWFTTAPVGATQKALAKAGWQVGDVDLWEINEAFAAQGLAVTRDLGLPDDAAHVNPNGGAIAIGHPLGMSGVRIALSAAIEMCERGEKRALASMCIGVGQGIAMLVESIDAAEGATR